jgi:hypothetical protein
MKSFTDFSDASFKIFSKKLQNFKQFFSLNHNATANAGPESAMTISAQLILGSSAEQEAIL